MTFLQETYRRMHPEVYFTPEKVMEFLCKEKSKEGDAPKLRLVMGNPPYKEIDNNRLE